MAKRIINAYKCRRCGFQTDDDQRRAYAQQAIGAMGVPMGKKCRIGFGPGYSCVKCRSDDVEVTKVEVKNSACFIATACYGSPECPEVRILRQFRDDAMMCSSLGRTLVAVYYRLSPPIAQLLNRHTRLRILVRECIVNPIVKRIGRL